MRKSEKGGERLENKLEVGSERSGRGVAEEEGHSVDGKRVRSCWRRCVCPDATRRDARYEGAEQSSTRSLIHAPRNDSRLLCVVTRARSCSCVFHSALN